MKNLKNFFLGRIVQWCGLPAMVSEFRHYDGETGQVVEIKTSPRYTTLKVDGKEFFFIRETGKYDGFGAMSVNQAISTSDCIADAVQRSTDAHEPTV